MKECYSASGVTGLLRRLGLCYEKPTHVPWCVFGSAEKKLNLSGDESIAAKRRAAQACQPVYALAEINRLDGHPDSHLRRDSEGTKIELIFLPPYSRNLCPIERYWKFFKKYVLNNRYYKTFEESKPACRSLFHKRREHFAGTANAANRKPSCSTCLKTGRLNREQSTKTFMPLLLKHIEGYVIDLFEVL